MSFGARACLRRLLSKRSPFFWVSVRPFEIDRGGGGGETRLWWSSFFKTKSKRSVCCVLDKAVEKSVGSRRRKQWHHHRRASIEAIERSRRRRRTRHRRRARTRGRTTDAPRKGTKRERERIGVWCRRHLSVERRWVTSFYFSNASRAVAANKRTTTTTTRFPSFSLSRLLY